MRYKERNSEIDFSAPAIKKQAMRAVVEHPLFVYPAVLGILGLIGAAAFDASLWFMGGGLIGVLATVASFGINFGMRREEFARRHVMKLMQRIEQDREAKVAATDKALRDLKVDEGSSQFRRLRDKFDTFRLMLDRKLDATELAHARYLGMAEQVFLAALDNLATVANTVQGLSTIDYDYTLKRMRKLSTHDDVSSRRERQAIEQRLELYRQQHDKVRELLSINEAAMTQMDGAMAALSDMRSGDHQASIDIETAMAELNRIAQRTKDIVQ